LNDTSNKSPFGKPGLGAEMSGAVTGAVRRDPQRDLRREELRVRLLIVDDEQTIRKLCVTVGEGLGFICLEADCGESALALLEEQPVHMVLSDMVMPRMSGLEFLEKVKKLLPRTEVALMTGHGSIETAVQSMKLGAYDYITKPFSPLEELRQFLRRMAEKVRLVEENEFLRQRMDSETAVHGIVGSSAKIQAHRLPPERHAHCRSHLRGKRHRERADRPRHSLPRRLRQPSFRGRRLRFARAHADRKRTLRL
jgi:CheY-like chemotaxis protein